jgi:hypothetical protein
VDVQGPHWLPLGFKPYPKNKELSVDGLYNVSVNLLKMWITVIPDCKIMVFMRGGLKVLILHKF